MATHEARRERLGIGIGDGDRRAARMRDDLLEHEPRITTCFEELAQHDQLAAGERFRERAELGTSRQRLEVAAFDAHELEPERLERGLARKLGQVTTE